MGPTQINELVRVSGMTMYFEMKWNSLSGIILKFFNTVTLWKVAVVELNKRSETRRK